MDPLFTRSPCKYHSMREHLDEVVMRSRDRRNKFRMDHFKLKLVFVLSKMVQLRVGHALK